MIGMLWKDILVLRKSLRTYVLLLGFYTVLTTVGAFELSMMAAMITIIVMMIPISAFAYDEQSRWEGFAAAMPLGRRAMVAGRYLFSLLMALLAASIGIVCSVIMGITGEGSPTEGLLTVLVSLGLGLLLVDVLLPLCYKLGAERARPFMYLVLLIPVVALFAAVQFGWLDYVDLSWLDSLGEVQLVLLFCAIPLAALAGMAASYLISCRVVEGKEY